MARKILLADDSVTAQNMGRKILADAGYDVITVNNGSAALKKIAEIKPDLIVLDVYMPGYSGLEVCQRVKEAGETSRIPILLTVGKLEPFKPEEARRVRADGYIVKPFEASELLSALTRLEDKIVPRSEASKPGRFARTIAAVEEGRYDKTVAAEKDSGWKERIGFPLGKKKKEVEADDVNDAAIYNPVNKDLRTVIERRTAQDAKTEEFRVDLGALASQGLPKDVTPEEIAALAAAAAQIKGVGAEAEVSSEPSATTPVALVDAGAEQKIEIAPSGSRPDTQVEIKAEEKIELLAEKLPEATGEPDNAPSPAAEAATNAALEPATYLSGGSGNGLESDRSDDGPVTMAAAAGTNSVARWTAVATALLPEEAALSLEQEMQKAYAAFAAAEVAYAPTAVAAAEPPASAESAISALAASVPEPEQISSAPASEIAPSSAFAAKNFEVASVGVADVQITVPPVAETTTSTLPEPVAESVSEAQSAIAASPVTESAPQEVSSASVAPNQPESVSGEPVQVEPSQTDPQPEHKTHEDLRGEGPRHEPSRPDPQSTLQAADAPSPEQRTEAIAMPEISASTPASGTSIEEAASTQSATAAAVEAVEVSSTPTSTSAPAERAEEPVQVAPARKESEIAETTAAAWATWRRIRESGDAKSVSPSAESAKSENKNQEVSVSPDAAAMAVAAGAEKAPEEASDSDRSDIANIVDSLLADLRPQLVAEVSKKMGKKK